MPCGSNSIFFSEPSGSFIFLSNHHTNPGEAAWYSALNSLYFSPSAEEGSSADGHPWLGVFGFLPDHIS